jgi:hypothetical protein
MLAVTPELTANTDTPPPPLTARVLGPGPSMVRFVTMSTVLERVIGELGGQDTENVIVSPDAAFATS